MSELHEQYDSRRRVSARFCTSYRIGSAKEGPFSVIRYDSYLFACAGVKGPLRFFMIPP